MSISAVTPVGWLVSILLSLIALLPRQALHRRHLAEELLHRHCRGAHHALARRDIAHDAGLRADARAAADGEVARQSPLRGDDDVIAEPRAAGNARLGNQHATASYPHVVPDLHQIINHRAGADHRIGSGAAVDRGVGADLHVILDDDAAELRHFDEALGIHGKAEAVLAQAHARVEPDARADEAVADADIGADAHVVAQHAARAYHGVGADMAAPADLGPGADHGMRLDRRAVAQSRRWINGGARRDA